MPLEVETVGTPKQWNNLNVAARAGRILLKRCSRGYCTPSNFHSYTVSFLKSTPSETNPYL
jgi:hypothetical protein